MSPPGLGVTLSWRLAGLYYVFKLLCHELNLVGFHVSFKYQIKHRILNETDFARYADDNTPYRTANTLDEVIQSLEHDSMMLFQWFSDNQMKANISKCHLLVNKKNEVTIRIGDTEIKNSEYEKLLGIKVDGKLNFNEHLNDIFSKASRKVNALSRVMP